MDKLPKELEHKITCVETAVKSNTLRDEGNGVLQLLAEKIYGDYCDEAGHSYDPYDLFVNGREIIKQWRKSIATGK